MHPRHHPTRVVIAAAREANARFLAVSPPLPPPPEATGAIYDSATSDVGGRAVPGAERRVYGRERARQGEGRGPEASRVQS